MELQFKGVLRDEGSPVHEAISAARFFTVRDNDEPWIYAYGPVVRGNPYQSLVYRAFGDHGLAVVPVTDPGAFLSLLKLRGQSRGIVYHLHWLSFVHQGATTPRKAAERTNRFMSDLRAFRAAGGKVVWTVHNMVSHDARFVDEELRLQQAIASEADLIHVMSEGTPALVHDVLRLPADKVVNVPHPSYLDAYEDYLPADQARLMLGIEPDETVYAVLGAIKSYKGVERLLEAFDLVLERSSTPRRLIVAGHADKDPASQELRRRLRMHPYVLLHDRRVPGDQVQRLLRASDLFVLPHERALNSGGALLGPSFDLPVVASRVGVLPEVLSSEFTEFFEGDGPEDVADALLRADRLVTPEARRAARSFAEHHHSRAVSRRLADVVRDRLNLDTDGPL